MDWYRTDVDWPRDPKILKAGPDGVLLFFAALAYTAEQETDGRIPKVMIPALIPRVLVVRPDRSAKAVTRAGLWIDAGDDFLIPKFVKKNPSHEEAEARRAANEERRDAERRRKADWRSRKGVPGSVPPVVPPDVPPDVPRDRDRDGDVPVPPIVPPLDTGRYGTERDEDLDPDSDLPSSGLGLQGLEGPDVFDEGQEEGQVEAKIQARFGLVLADDQVFNLAQLAKANPLFGDVWPGLFEGRTMAVVSEALMRARTRDLDAVTHPRSWLKALMDEVGPTIGTPEANGSDPKTDQKPARKRSKKSAES